MSHLICDFCFEFAFYRHYRFVSFNDVPCTCFPGSPLFLIRIQFFGSI